MAKRPSILGKQQNGTGLWASVNNFLCTLPVLRSGAVLAFERVPEVRNNSILLQLPRKAPRIRFESFEASQRHATIFPQRLDLLANWETWKWLCTILSGVGGSQNQNHLSSTWHWQLPVWAHSERGPALCQSLKLSSLLQCGLVYLFPYV
jgi:hypothetical protein